MTIFQAKNVLSVCIALRLDIIQKKLISDVISQKLGKENVLVFLKMEAEIIRRIRESYTENDMDDYGDEMDQDNEEEQEDRPDYVCFDDFDDYEELEQNLKVWLEFFEYSIDVAAESLEEIESKQT